MIHIAEPSKCCGCSACAQRCPQSCITMQADAEGFEYPVVDQSKCVDCHLCETVCPVLNRQDSREPIAVFSAKHNSEPIRMSSSSGGVFSLLAQMVLEQNGVVFGARFDSQWNVVHDYIESMEDLHLFRGSKYLQSQIGNCFAQAERFLKEGRLVLFTGTPCQIAGLNAYLGKNYENLLSADIVCHGAPSPKFWQDYLSSLGIKGIQSINFRCKETGWKSYSVKVVGENETYMTRYSNDQYFQAFLSDLSLRPSCYSCPAKAGSSHSDITLGDFWGIAKFDAEMDDDKGVSLVLVHTPNGEKHIKAITDKGMFKSMSYEMAVEKNPSIIRSSKRKECVDEFWRRYHRDGIKGVSKMLKKMRRPKLTLGVIIYALKTTIYKMIKR